MKKRILIIDDDADLGEQLQEAIGGEGYLVDFADDGESGLEMIDRDGYDLVFLDLKMQKVSGIDVLKVLRGRERSFKIVVLTGRPLRGDTLGAGGLTGEERGMLEVADATMGKPFDVEELLRLVREMVGDPGP